MESPPPDLELSVQVHSDFTIREEVQRRVHLMVHATLETSSQHGKWRFVITGVAQNYTHTSRYLIAITLTENYSFINVALKASLTSDGAISGILFPPKNIVDLLVTKDRRGCNQWLKENLTPAATTLNDSGWHGIFESETREPIYSTESLPKGLRRSGAATREIRAPVPESWRTVVREPLPKWSSDSRSPPRSPALLHTSVSQFRLSKPVDRSIPPTSTSRATSETPPWSLGKPVESSQPKRDALSSVWSTPQRPANRTQERESAMKSRDGLSVERRNLLAQVLQQALVGHPDGILTIHQITSVARDRVEEENDRWYRMGPVHELVGLGWIHRIDSGQYEVRQIFLDQYPINGITLNPHPTLKRGHRTNGEASLVEVAPTRPKPSDMIQMIKCVLAERAKLVRAVTEGEQNTADARGKLSSLTSSGVGSSEIDALTKTRDLIDTIIGLEKETASAQAALASYEEEIREGLVTISDEQATLRKILALPPPQAG